MSDGVPDGMSARLSRLREERDALARKAAELEAALQANRARADRLQQFEALLAAGQLFALDFPIAPRVRYGHGAPPHPRLAQLIGEGESKYRRTIESFLPFLPDLLRVAPRSESADEPCWLNEWMPPFDAVSLYGFLASRNPRLYVEIGSGMSTKFARRAIRDRGLRTRIVSIDPAPRSEIDSICDEIVREKLEEADLSRFASLGQEDVLFCDGSHRAFQNSDATVFFTEILPALAKGVFVGVHDIFLPNDYPEGWLTRYYNEQYLLACYLLAGDKLSIELPVYYCSGRPELHRVLDALWKSPALADAPTNGGAFWFTIAS